MFGMNESQLRVAGGSVFQKGSGNETKKQQLLLSKYKQSLAEGCQARNQDFQRGVTFRDSSCQINFNGIA